MGASSSALRPTLGPWRDRTTIFSLLGLRHAEPEVARAVPGLRRVEHARRGARAARAGGARGGRRGRRAGPRPARRVAAARRAAERVAAALHRHRRARPRARRRARPGLARPARRLARDRQVDADGHGARPPRRAPAGATLYVSGEESAAQIRLRAERLGDAARSTSPCSPRPTSTPSSRRSSAERPEVCVLDSVQTLHAAALDRRARHGRPGPRGRDPGRAGGQARGTAVVLVGHVTKEGSLAGPRVLEHLVDCVLQFEGERERTYRTLRALKNRFGSTNDVGVFEMAANGLAEVARRQRALRRRGDERARAVSCSRRWRARGRCSSRSRRSSRRPSSSRRGGSCNGFDRNRLALVLAVLGRHARRRDRHRRRVRERRRRRARRRARAPTSRSRWPWRARPAASPGDEPASARPASARSGLTGELRSVAHPERRAAEAAKFGLRRSLSPEVARRAALRAAVARRGGLRRTRIARPRRARLTPRRWSDKPTLKDAARIGTDGAAFRG